jgi:Ca2+/Na+ antiporter
MKIDPALVSTTQARVRMSARELRENQMRLRTLWISCGLSWLLGTLTAPLLWQALAWLERSFEISQVVRIMVFVFCWVAPATVVAAVIAWSYSHATSTGNGPEAWER